MSEWAEWVEISWGFYLEKQKQNIPKNISFKPMSLNISRYIEKMALDFLSFSEGHAISLLCTWSL